MYQNQDYTAPTDQRCVIRDSIAGLAHGHSWSHAPNLLGVV